MILSNNTPFAIKSGFEITKSTPYLNAGPNRRQRRSKPSPFIGNGKQYPITVSGKMKYLRTIQIVPTKIVDGVLKGGNKILHYLPA